MYGIRKIMCFLIIKACQHILFCYQIHKIKIFKIATYDLFHLFMIVWNCKHRPIGAQ